MSRRRTTIGAISGVFLTDAERALDALVQDHAGQAAAAQAAMDASARVIAAAQAGGISHCDACDEDWYPGLHQSCPRCEDNSHSPQHKILVAGKWCDRDDERDA